ncbi:hypothetical protein MKX03_023843 [Papaver bracteatum]|nr:hypothetical protein MKX03_023843 [Papaver bracteatum]
MDVPPLLVLLQQWLREAAIKRYSNLQLLSLSFLVLAISVLLHRIYSLSKTSKTYKLPPSPPRIPILGNLHQLDALAHRSFRDLSQKYGPLMLLHLGQSPNLVVSSVEMATEIMKNQDLVFANRPSTTAAVALLYGCTDISFAPYGEYWRQVRKICVLELLSAKRVQSFKNLRGEEVNDVIQIISSTCSSSSDGVVINLSKLLLTLANNIISRCALGAKYESVHENKFGQLSREVFSLLGTFSFHDYFPSVGWMDVVTGLSSKLKKVSQELDDFFDQVIDEHLLRHSKAQDGHGQIEDANKLDLMDILLLSQKDNTNVSRNNIKAIILV